MGNKFDYLPEYIEKEIYEPDCTKPNRIYLKKKSEFPGFSGNRSEKKFCQSCHEHHLTMHCPYEWYYEILTPKDLPDNVPLLRNYYVDF